MRDQEKKNLIVESFVYIELPGIVYTRDILKNVNKNYSINILKSAWNGSGNLFLPTWDIYPSDSQMRKNGHMKFRKMNDVQLNL